MSRAVNNEGCAICGDIPYDNERRVLVVGRVRQVYCSQACLRTGVRKLQIARRKARLRAATALLAIALVGGVAFYVRHLLRRARPHHAPVATAAPVAPPPPAEEPTFGPHWPPTDEEWQAVLAHAAWVYPLPGPTRRAPASCRDLFDGAGPARCRVAGRCGVDVGGELWGEHVYAALDGVIDRLQRDGDDARGGVSVRIAHLGGAVFTHYHHLAAVPTRVRVGTRVEAGEVIGLVGDTGLPEGRARLHFALSIQPSSALPEVFWDPEPLMAAWPLHTPTRGSVAGLVAIDAPPEPVAGTPSVVRPIRAR